MSPTEQSETEKGVVFVSGSIKYQEKIARLRLMVAKAQMEVIKKIVGVR